MKEEIVKKLFEYIDGTKDFVLENLPEVFQQIALWGRTICIIDLVIGSILLVLSIYGINKNLILVRNRDICALEDYKFKEPRNRVFMWIFSVLSIVGLIYFISGIHGLKAFIAPKLFIIDYLRGK